MPFIAENRRARFDYEFLQKWEVGIVLSGAEVKSVKEGHINLKGAYVHLKDEEVYLINAHVARYAKSGTKSDYDAYRSRKLLMHKKEIAYLIGKMKVKGLTIIPLRVYTKANRIKLEIALVRPKKGEDKREDIKKREVSRQISRAIKGSL